MYLSHSRHSGLKYPSKKRCCQENTVIQATRQLCRARVPVTKSLLVQPCPGPTVGSVLPSANYKDGMPGQGARQSQPRPDKCQAAFMYLGSTG